MTTAPERLVLPDDAARHTIRYRIDSTLFVEAAAGSGKTTALVSRIVQLLRCGAATLDSLAAITFTEAAALELNVRVRRALVELEETSGDADEVTRARAALDRLDEAAISTIHGFCQRLLAEHPIEAGLAPRIEILDEVQQSLAWREQWSSVLDRAGEDAGLSRLFSLAALLGVTATHLETLAKEAADEWDRRGMFLPDSSAVVAAVGAVVEREAAVVVDSLGRALALQAHCSDADDNLLAKLSTARDLHDRLVAVAVAVAVAVEGEGEGEGAGDAAAMDERLSILVVSRPPFNVGNTGQRASWTCDIDEVRSYLTEAQAAMDRVVTVVSDLVLPALVAFFDVVAREAATARRLEGRLVFHDLLVLARDLLADNPAVLEEARRKYRFVLIDEFQDTDPLQLEIAELLGGARPDDGPACADDQPPVRLDAGRLFFVGDPQQSIYRFRGADLPAYRRARDWLAESGPLPLTSNFRSVPGIAEFVNECFGVLMPDAYSALHAVRDRGQADPPVHILGGPLDPTLKRHEQRVLESEACADAIDRAVRTEGWLVDDGGATRPARMSDVAILVPRRTGLDEIETALDSHDIGYRVESASLVYRTQEVRDLLALCRAIDDPGDRVALLAALRSPAFACGDDELLAFRRLGGSWSIERPPPDLPAGDGSMAASPAVVAEALGRLAVYRSRRFELGPVGVLEEAVRDRRLLQLAAGSPRARESWRRVRFLIERARAFVAGGGGGLRAFADWVEEQLSEGLRSVESVLPEPDEDVVHILTVHAAKGLEFPITVLAGFGTSDDIPAGVGRKVLRHAGRVEVHLTKRLATLGFAALKAAEDALEREEAIRVLYVAATRARDHLVVCGHHVVPRAPGAAGTLGQRLYEAAQGALSRRPGLWVAMGLSGVDEVAAGLAGVVAGELAAGAAGEVAAGVVGEVAAGVAGEGAAGAAGEVAAGVAHDPDESAGHTGPTASRASQGALFDLAAVADLEPGVVAKSGRPPATSPADWHDWQRDRARLLARISRRRSVRATELTELAGRAGLAGFTHDHRPQATPDPHSCPDPDPDPDQTPDSDLTPATDTTTTPHRGRGGTQLGRAVHSTLQSIDLTLARRLSTATAAASPQAGEQVRTLAHSEATREGIADRADEVERLTLAALSSPTVRRAFADRRPKREVYVATTVEGLVLDGYVDLCFEDEGGLVVVDYKTDTLGDGAAVEDAARRYELQAAAYALALGDATGLPVRRCVLVFLSPPGEPKEYEVPDLEAAMDKVRTLVAGAA